MEEPLRPIAEERPVPRPLVPMRPDLSPLPAALAFLGGVLMPLASLAVEIPSHLCADVFFDPLPSWIHGVLYALIPVAVVLALRRVARPFMGFLVGAATGVAGVYTLIFLPITPIAVMAIMFMGLGLCALSPLTSLLSLLWLRKRVDSRGYLQGLGLAVLLLVLLESPSLAARTGASMARSGDPDVRSRGVELLRRTDEEALRTLCYGDFHRPFDFLGNLLGLLHVGPDDARQLYYRAYGRPFNSLPRPPLPGRSAMRGDWEQGGEAVGSRLAGLDLVNSRIQGSLEPDAALAYLEWTLEFRNRRPAQAEARCEVALPPGAVVSRATLWVNGQEREAAYGSREQTRQAYEAVVAQRRDPLLVTTAGPDRVLVQCFPVPPGGTMKIKLGLTTPLQHPDEGHAWLPLPRLAERNFEVAVRHGLVLDSHARIDSALPEELDDETLSRLESGVLLRRSASDAAWTPDPDRTGGIVVARLREEGSARPLRVVLAVDGSAGMAPFQEDLAAALDGAPEDMQVALLVSTDSGVAEASGGRDLGPREAAAFLRDFRFAGGRDAAPLLARAAERAGKVDPVLWVHAPQPVQLEFLGRWPARLVDAPVEIGPDVIRAELPSGTVEPLARRDRLATDLARYFRGAPSLRWVRTAEAGGPPAGALETSRHLARLYAADRVRDLVAAGRRAEAVKVAVRHRLVTEVSGAVVLESQAQYDAAGLEPVDSGTVPTIPEPSTALLLAVAAAVLARVRRRAA